MSQKSFEVMVPLNIDFNLMALLQQQWPEQVNAHDVVTGFVIVMDSETEHREHEATHAHGNLGELSVVWPGVHARVNPHTGQARVFLNNFIGNSVAMRVTLANTGGESYPRRLKALVPLNKRFNLIAAVASDDLADATDSIESLTARIGETVLTFAPSEGRAHVLVAVVPGDDNALSAQVDTQTGNGFISWPDCRVTEAELLVSLINYNRRQL